MEYGPRGAQEASNTADSKIERLHIGFHSETQPSSQTYINYRLDTAALTSNISRTPNRIIGGVANTYSMTLMPPLKPAVALHGQKYTVAPVFIYFNTMGQKGLNSSPDAVHAALIFISNMILRLWLFFRYFGSLAHFKNAYARFHSGVSNSLLPSEDLDL